MAGGRSSGLTLTLASLIAVAPSESVVQIESGMPVEPELSRFF